MPHKTTYVVQISGTSLFLTGYNAAIPENSIFGNVQDAIEFATLEDAEDAASLIGNGTVGTTKP